MLLWFISAFLFLLVVILSVKLYLIKVGLREIELCIDRHLNTDTNAVITLSSNDRTLKRFAVGLNVQLKALRKQRLLYQNGDKELKEAVTNLSHDIRTPLTSICGYLDLVEAERDYEKIKRYVSLLRNRTDNLKAMTEQLLRYSVIMSTADELKIEKVNINRILEESVLAFYSSFSEKGIEPKVTIMQKQLYCNADRVALNRVFNNIISNAIKYSDGDMYVELKDNKEVVFSNTAKSLSGVDVGRLFNRFFSVSTGGNATGLGLSIAKTLSERMNIKIAAQYKGEMLYICINLDNMA